MQSGLPINLDDLIHGRGVEGNRVEFKGSWNAMTEPAIVATVCAFANDLLNLNGGYVLLGLEEVDGRAVLPPRGVDNPDLIQRKIFAACRSIKPDYQPRVFAETLQGTDILVLWCPGGDVRPYQAPKGKEGHAFFVRHGSVTTSAQGDILRQLVEQTAKVPFDDRACHAASVLDLSAHMVRSFLREVGSRLYEEQIPDEELFRRLDLLRRTNGHEVPRQVALLFFNGNPERFLSDVYIDLVRFGDDAGKMIEERVFRGPLHEQIQACLNHLQGQNSTLVATSSESIRASRVLAYPPEALREAVANAVYHRGYDAPRQPIKVYVYPDRLAITSYPGPHPRIRQEDLSPGHVVPPGIPARNRRIGEFLKELRLAESRGTGIPKIRREMQTHGSPQPEFDFHPGEEQGYFTITLPIHPEHAAHEARRLWDQGQRDAAFELLKSALARQPDATNLVCQMIAFTYKIHAPNQGMEALKKYVEGTTPQRQQATPFIEMALGLLSQHPPSSAQKEAAVALLAQMPMPKHPEDLWRAATAFDSADVPAQAHVFAEMAYVLRPRNLNIMSILAGVKTRLAEALEGAQREQLLCEAAILYERILQKRDPMARDFWPLLTDTLTKLGLAQDERLDSV